MTTPDKLSRERLEYLRWRPAARSGEAQETYSSPYEEQSMAAEILALRDENTALREEVERLRRSQAHVRSLAPWPPVAVSSINPGPDGQIPLTPDPELVRLRLRVDAIEQGMLRHRQ